MTPQELIGELYEAVDNDDMYSRSYLVYAVEDLCTESAKLRELVLDYEELTAKLCDSRECDGCPFDTESTMCKNMHMLLRVGELGIGEDA